MILLCFLRMIVDLGFFYAFAGVLLTLFGIRALVLPVVIMCLCYGISVGLQKCGSRNGNGLHLLVLAPMIFVFILPGTTLYQCVALAPGVLYVLYMALSKNNALSWYRQVNVFSLFCKVYIIFAAFVSMVGGLKIITSDSIPFALMVVFASVILMRTLRHEPAVYLQRSFQVRNILTVLSLVILARLLSVKFLINGIFHGVKTFYLYIIAPVLQLIIMVMGYIILCIASVLGWTLSKIGLHTSIKENTTTAVAGVQNLIDSTSTYEGSSVWGYIIAVVGILVLLAIIWLFYRWISRRPSMQAPVSEPVLVRTAIKPSAKDGLSLGWQKSSVTGVRRQYRRFLKLCKDNGQALRESDTSLDVNRRAQHAFNEPESLEAFRELYIRARYDGRAEGKDAALARKLFGMIRKNSGD